MNYIKAAWAFILPFAASYIKYRLFMAAVRRRKAPEIRRPRK